FACFLAQAAWVWGVSRSPAVESGMEWLMFLVCGVALGGLFVAKVVHNLRTTRLLGMDRPVDFNLFYLWAAAMDSKRGVGQQQPSSGGGDVRRGYVGNIVQSAKSVLEGMAVTFSYMFRKPTTIQYPDRVPMPVSEMLPERYRGFLEVDMDICTACKACERECPINCI